MKKYIVWYKTLSGKFTREIKFFSYKNALNLFEDLDRDFKYLIEVTNGKHKCVIKGGK